VINKNKLCCKTDFLVVFPKGGAKSVTLNETARII
jgi:hypothetical protein